MNINQVQTKPASKVHLVSAVSKEKVDASKDSKSGELTWQARPLWLRKPGARQNLWN